MKTINPLPSDDKDRHQQFQVPIQDSTQSTNTSDRQAAAQLVRGQIDQLYTSTPSPEEATPQATSSPYNRTHQSGVATDPATNQSDALKKYHSAWQQYYQQYYQRYYMEQLEHHKKSIGEHKTKEADTTEINPQDATKQIHNEIVEKVKKQAASLRRSTHFMPIMTAIFVGVLFMFIQYNRLFTAQVKAYVTPGGSTAQSIILDPVTDTRVGPEPRVIIPKINVDAPIVYGVNSLEDGPVQVALRDGVVHYPLPGANSVPGQAGNTVLLGHSSNDVFDSGGYKFVFVLLEKLNPGDTFYLHHNSTRYTYTVTHKEVIDPTEVNKLIVPTDKPLVSLVTCVPPGTALKRLVVWAEQISPDPSNVAEAPTTTKADNSKPSSISGDGSGSLIDRLFRN